MKVTITITIELPDPGDRRDEVIKGRESVGLRCYRCNRLLDSSIVVIQEDDGRVRHADGSPACQRKA